MIDTRREPWVAAGTTETSPVEELVGTVNVWELRQFSWPIQRLLSRHFVEELELERFLARLLSTGRWSTVRAVPHREAQRVSDHEYDVYGAPSTARW